MSYKLHDLQSMPFEELEKQHDEAAQHTTMGVNYFLDELHRRDQIAAIKASGRLARMAFIVSMVSTVAAVVALFVR